jgi:hypothetical protein
VCDDLAALAFADLLSVRVHGGHGLEMLESCLSVSTEGPMNDFRPREEILKQLQNVHGGFKPEWLIFMEVLLDIRDLLDKIEAQI